MNLCVSYNTWNRIIIGKRVCSYIGNSNTLQFQLKNCRIALSLHKNIQSCIYFAKKSFPKTYLFTLNRTHVLLARTLNNNYAHQCIIVSSYCTNGKDLCLNNEKVKLYLTHQRYQYEAALMCTDNSDVNIVRRLKPVMQLLDEVEVAKTEILELMSLVNDPETDNEMKSLAKMDIKNCSSKINEMENEIFESLIPIDKIDDTNVIIEVSAGVGGQEAMLFCQEVFDMYQGYAAFMEWDHNITEYDTTDIGGLRYGSLVIKGFGVYGRIKYEGGVHRVQRVPKTEKSGRIHTSTITVAVLPQPSEIDIQINDSELKIETKRASGAGGQHVNTTDSAIRIVHLPTGIAVESQSHRSQIQNKQEALFKLRAKLYQLKLDASLAKQSSNRKLQVGSKSRSEKVRTYNYPQDRVTDHRIGISVHKLTSMLEGSDVLHSLINLLLKEASREALYELISKEHQPLISKEAL